MRAEREAWKEERRKKKKRERDGRTWPCKQRGYAAAASLFSSPLLSSPLLSSPLRCSPLLGTSVRSLARVLLVALRGTPVSVPFVPEPSSPLRPSLYIPRSAFPSFSLSACTRTRVHACSRVFVDRRARDAEGRIFFRMGYLTRWPGQ